MSKSKRGPARKAGKREANGRLSRKPDMVSARKIAHYAKVEQETLAPALDARERIWGVAPAVSKDQFAGTFVGRLFLGGDLTRMQLEAAQIYHQECVNNSLACAGPAPPKAVNLNATHGASVDMEDVAQTRKWRMSYKLSREAVQAKQDEIHGNGNLFGALSICVLQDQPLTHLVGDLRIALNALVRHYGLMRKSAA